MALLIYRSSLLLLNQPDFYHQPGQAWSLKLTALSNLATKPAGVIRTQQVQYRQKCGIPACSL
ncbi:MAG: hypothetical protein WDZ60_08650, partial [Wenzhouxiangellaceae bacterium]